MTDYDDMDMTPNPAKKKPKDAIVREAASIEGERMESAFARAVKNLTRMLPEHPAAVDVEMTFRAVKMTSKGFIIPRKTDESTMEIRLATQIPSAANR